MSAGPVSIQHARGEPAQQTPPTCVYGTSPGSAPSSGRQDKHSSGSQAARKLLRRIQWDSSLDETEWTVGVLKNREQAERKSGAEAWSLRVQSTVVEFSFADFVAKYDREGEEVPFHRIAWFKQSGALIWEAEHLRHKLGDQHHAHGYSGNGSAAGLSMSPALGNSLLSCSPPTGSFMARLAAAASGPTGCAGMVSASGSSFTGLPPRCSNSPLDGTANTSAQHGTPQQQLGWRPHRLSGTDMGNGGSSSWCAGAAGPLRDASSPWPGPLTASHVGFTPYHAGNGCASGHVGHMTPSPLLGSSPSSSSMPGCSGGGLPASLLGSSPHIMSASWAAGELHSRSSSAGGACGPAVHRALGGPECSALSYMSASPAGSCSSSWTGTSPLAAAAAAGVSSLRGLSSSSCGGGVGNREWGQSPGVSLPAGGLAAAIAAVGYGDSGVASAEQQQQVFKEEPVLADYSQLPEKCWMDVLQRLGVRELCCAARVNRSLRGLTARTCLWSSAYQRLFGTPAPPDWSGPTVKRLCRRSELRASRWLEADVEACTMGFSSTWCCQLDESKVVSGDGCAVRLWAHESGRRIATLRGHSGRVTSVAFDDEVILSGCSQGVVKLWSMDELKLSKTLRHHTGPVSATLLLHGLPISGSKDGMVCMWDVSAPNTPLVVLEAGGPVHSMQLMEERRYLITGSNTLGVWDMETTQALFTLDPPTSTPAGSTPLSGSSSSASLAATAAAATAAAAAAAVAADVDVTLEEDDVLLQNGWLLQDDESDSDLSDDDEGVVPAGGMQQQQQQQAAPAVGQAGGTSARSSDAPWTSISCHGNLLAAGSSAGVVLWDVRTQEAVGSIPAGGAASSFLAASSPRARSGGSTGSSVSCVGVQLDDWRLVTGFTAAGSRGSGGGHGSSGGGSTACWWHSGGDVSSWADESGFSGGGANGHTHHSLEVYDIRAAASFSSAPAAGAGASSSSAASSASGRAGLWSALPVLSLPVPHRITCFQFHGQHLLVGQEGADCCLLSFHPPGSRSGHAAAAWGFGGPPSAPRTPSAYAAAGIATGASPGAQVYMASPGTGGAGYVDEAGGSGGGRKGKKEKATKVPAKKQTRYPKRATR